ncbi:MAG: hypothetical protein IJT16_10800 [Lachnospiraceae bacterium]|nr:hypothetical protein [Lachnospiraceae bacterium]
MKIQDLSDNLVLIDLEELMRVTSFGRRRALKFAEMAKARVMIGRSLRFDVQKLKEFSYYEAF